MSHHRPRPPFLEINVRGVRITIREVPYRLITLLGTAASTGVITWISSR